MIDRNPADPNDSGALAPRARSTWGWGWADKFPDREARTPMAEMASSMLGFPGQEVEEPVPLDQAAMPAPRIVPPDNVAAICTTDRRERALHTYGKSWPDLIRGFRGDYAVAPDVVAHPRTEHDVVAVLQWCAEAGIACIPFGGGTSVVSGTEPDVGPAWAGTVSLDMRRMDALLEVDEHSLAARLQAGATGPWINEQLAAHGLTLRCFPQSWEFATLGGMIVTRAGGHYATVRTHIDDLVESLRMVTPAGAWASRRLPGSGAGPSPDRMVLGSEGILGVVTEAWMKVQRKPRFRSKADVRFAAFGDAVEATRLIAQSGLDPANCRVLDAREAMLNQVTTDGSTVLLLGFESADHAQAERLVRALAIAEAHGGTCPAGPQHRDDGEGGRDGGAAGSWRDAFFGGPYLRDVLLSVGIIADTFETAITWDRFEALHAALIQRVRATMKEVCGAGRLTCRFTHVYPDGPAPYYTFIAPARRGDEIAQWAAIKETASEVLMEHGATITHHHAVGRLHRPWYERQRPVPMGDVLRAMKDQLDPTGMLNPGVLIQER
ncbi:MAG: FAD-binding oxidoreductase [Proteobacteria bacterium]|nr:FAD-binding oxidoreductase [Pseudomonadota bacterium]